MYFNNVSPDSPLRVSSFKRGHNQPASSRDSSSPPLPIQLRSLVIGTSAFLPPPLLRFTFPVARALYSARGCCNDGLAQRTDFFFSSYFLLLLLFFFSIERHDFFIFEGIGVACAGGSSSPLARVYMQVREPSFRLFPRL